MEPRREGVKCGWQDQKKKRQGREREVTRKRSKNNETVL